MLVLSLMPGIDLLGMAFKAEGFCVVQGGDPIFGGDVRTEHYPPGRFDGIISGPPCQMFSSLARLVEANGHKTRFGNLIPEFERCVAEAQPDWFVMENVPQAPVPAVAGYGITPIVIDNSALLGEGGMGLEQRRVRRFSFGLRGREAPNLARWIDLAVFLLPDANRAVSSGTNFPHDEEFKSRQPAMFGDGRPTRQEHRHPAVTSTDGGERPSEAKARVSAVTSNVGGGGSDSKPQPGKAANGRGRYKLADALRLQGLPETFLDDAPFTADGKLKAVANGVALPTGKAIAKAVMEALKLCAK